MNRRFWSLGWLLVGAFLLGGRPTAQAAAPVIGRVELVRRAVHNAPGWRAYADSVRVIASDEDGAVDIVSIAVTRPGGVMSELCLTRPAFPFPHRVDASLTTPESLTTPADGVFTVTVTDRAGHRATRSGALIGAPRFLEPVSPAPDTTLAAGPTTFQWKGARGPSTTVQLVWEPKPMEPAWQAEVKRGPEVAGRDARGKVPELRPGYSYVWVTRSRTPQPSTDPRVTVYQEQVLRVRCRTSEAEHLRSSVPGTLLYGYYYPTGALDSACEGVVRYSANPSAPTWTGPVGISYPDLAPDGRQLVYVTQQALWLDRQDGTPPTRLADGFCRDPRWSPDMRQIVFVRGENLKCDGSPGNLDLWLINADGSGARPLAHSPTENERFPCWSPDGNWIVYRSIPGAPETALYAIRPDGREAHPVAGGLVVGHEDFGPSWLENADWSPDGTQLVVIFSTSSNASSTEERCGVGLMSPEGGPIRPLFITPPGGDVNTMPGMPKWSPDGRQVAFVSAHHLIGTKEPFYPGPEVWVTNADGSGEPVRLTYDHSRVNSVRWR